MYEYHLIVNTVGGDGEKEWTLFFVVVVTQLRNVEKQTDVHVQCTMVESAGNSSKVIKYGQYTVYSKHNIFSSNCVLSCARSRLWHFLINYKIIQHSVYHS